MSIMSAIKKAITGKDREHPNVGRKFRSLFLRDTVVITAFNSDSEWWFVYQKQGIEHKAGTSLTFLIEQGLEKKE